MIFIVGLGNPGKEYERNRHNTGFMAINMLAEKMGLTEWKLEKSFHAEVIKTTNFVLIKPQTFMNKSGEAVRAVLQYYDKQLIESGQFPNLYVIYDDLDMELGQYKIQFATHPKIHNGVNSVLESLGSENFWNVRVGIDSRKGERVIPPEQYVLMQFSSEERAAIEATLKNVVQDIHARCTAS